MAATDKIESIARAIEADAGEPLPGLRDGLREAEAVRASVRRLPLIDGDGEVRELTAEDFARFRPAHEVLPADLQKTLGIRRRGPQKTPTKVATTIRLSPEVVEHFRCAGDGWQARIDGVLSEYVAKSDRATKRQARA